MDSDRGEWRSRTGFVLAAAGSAVGLGNIWKFPYLTGQNGGAAFLIVYLVLVSTIGVGVMLAGGLAGGGDIDSLASAFRTFTAPLEPLVYLALFMALTVAVVAGGVRHGIERWCILLFPALIAIMLPLDRARRDRLDPVRRAMIQHAPFVPPRKPTKR